MTRKIWFASTACAFALAVACSKQSTTPTAPNPTDVASGNAAADGSTLKVSAPTPVSPINGVQLTAGETLTLVVNNATATFASGVELQYEFELQNAAGQRVTGGRVNGGSGTTRMTVSADLEGEQTYRWRARAVLGSNGIGPWSSLASFVAPLNDGYIRGTELYDPLTNGKTVGEVHGPVQFIPGVGVKLLDWTSYISYQLPQTLLEGEYSLLVTNMPANTKGDKQKVMAMAQGYDDIIENDRRMTIEKRGDPPGIIAWRFITHHDRIETIGAERTFYNFQASETYFFNVTWRNNFFNLQINEGGVSGRSVYDRGKRWSGDPYDPKPHVIYVGSPIGRSGASSASIENTIYRQIWVSSRPRPAFANR